MNVLLAGPHGGYNLGDEFILSEIARDVIALGNHVHVMASNPSYIRDYHGLTAVPAFNPRQGQFLALRQLRKYDALVIAGGDQLQEARWGNPLWGLLANVSHLVRYAAKCGLPSMLWGVGMDTIRTVWGEWLVRNWVARTTAITVRDESSLMRLTALGVDPQMLSLSADPVFRVARVSHAEARQRLLARLGIEINGPLVLVSPANDHRISLDYLGPLLDACCEVATARGGRVIIKLMDVQPRYDRALLQRPEIVGRPEVVILDSAEFDRGGLIDLFAAVDVVVALRMHALILAMTQGTPWLNIARSVKMTALAEEFTTPPLSARDLQRPVLERHLFDALDTSRLEWCARIDPSVARLAKRAGVSPNVFHSKIMTNGRAPAHG